MFRTILLVVAAIGACASGLAQAPSDVKDGRVAVIGENPGIRLATKDGAPPSTSVSFWRVFQSPAGMGHVCFVTSDVAGDGPTPDDIRLAFADNAKLADYVASQLMTAFDKAYGEKPFPVRTARFERSGDTATAWKETIRSEGYTIDLVWRDFYEPFAIESKVGVPHNPYTILSTFIPAKTAEVTINGKRAAGTATPRMRGTRQSSSSFLAFAETWLKPDPQSVAECLQAAQTYAGRRVQELRAAGQMPDYAKLTQEAADLAKAYAARFPIASVATADLTPLARLCVLAKQPDLAQQAIAKRLATPGTTDAEKADALVAAVDISMGSPTTDEGVRQAEAYAAQLDAIKSAGRQQIQAHSRLGGYYRGVDVDDRIFEHGNKVIALGRGLPTADRATMATTLAGAYTNVAEVYGGWEQADKAIAILEQGQKDLGSTTAVTRQIEPTLARYRLVGTVAAPIEAPRWLNAPAAMSKIDPKGTVTLVEFTAHWCTWCRRTYPSIVRLQATWAPKGLQVIFATELYGFLGQQRPLTPEQEIAADRKYFTEEHALPFKIAIENQRPAGGPNATAQTVAMNGDRYKVGGIPQIVVIDKQGRIRLIIIGSDPASEARLNKLVERLLAEPTT
jgi:thiol-disulfide isomerase/thioredoxin